MTSERKRPVIIWGAGRIGRGFVAEAFDSPGYQLVLVDIVKPLIDSLNQAGKYTIHHADASGIRDTVITGYVAHETGDEKALLPYFLGAQPIVCVPGFASKVMELAQMMAHYVELRAEKTPDDPIDFVLSINMMHPEVAFREALKEALSGDEKVLQYLDAKVGIAPTVVMCITPATPEEYLLLDPLSIYNNNFPELIIGKKGLRGALPAGGMIRLTDDIDAEETRKIYSLNMVHALVSYLCQGKPYKYIIDAVNDTEIVPQLIAALEESAIGLTGEFGFTIKEMRAWNQRMFSLLENPHISDDLIRLGSDSLRKLGGDDRLVGAARLSLKHGGTPKIIAKAIRLGYEYKNPDEGTEEVQRLVQTEGLIGAMRKVSSIEDGEALEAMILNS